MQLIGASWMVSMDTDDRDMLIEAIDTVSATNPPSGDEIAYAIDVLTKFRDVLAGDDNEEG
ncbi:MAG: hypothetical protein IPO08_22065 [Xanthomonadales bacterium]|nr:hypothetical protein [Xanthomonadales bacterium]